MNKDLPVHQPPWGWTVRRNRDSVFLQKSAAFEIDHRHVVAAAVAGICPILFEVFIQSVVQGQPVAEVLLQFQTLRLLWFLPVLVGIALLARHYFSQTTTFALFADRLEIRHGNSRLPEQVIPRNRVTALVRYQPSDADSQQASSSVVLEWIKPDRETSGLLVGSFARQPEEQQWLIRILEAWSGRTLRTASFPQEEDNEAEST